MSETINIHLGQCGIQMGYKFWEAIVAQHGLLSDTFDLSNHNLTNFFDKMPNNHFSLRALFIDLESNVLNDLRKSPLRSLINTNQFISTDDEAGCNFARAYYGPGKRIYKQIQSKLYNELEKCDKVDNISVWHSLGGGAGSGLSPLIFQIVADNVKKVNKWEYGIIPSKILGSATVEPYNAILNQHFLLDDVNLCFPMDNESIYTILENHCRINDATINDINKVTSQITTAITCPSRYSDCSKIDYFTNLIPYPRIHFPITSYSPYCPCYKETNDINDLTCSVFDSQNSMASCCLEQGKFFSCLMLYQGDVSPAQVNEALSQIKDRKNIRFVDWAPTGFKVAISPSIAIDNEIVTPDDLPNVRSCKKRDCLMVSSNSSISEIFLRLSSKFHMLISKHCFVHWYIAEGLDETEMYESLYNIASLAKDYEEIGIDIQDNDAVNINEIFDRKQHEGENFSKSSSTNKNKSCSINHEEICNISNEYQEIVESLNSADFLGKSVSIVGKLNISPVFQHLNRSSNSSTVSCTSSNVKSGESNSNYPQDIQQPLPQRTHTHDSISQPWPTVSNISLSDSSVAHRQEIFDNEEACQSHKDLHSNKIKSQIFEKEDITENENIYQDDLNTEYLIQKLVDITSKKMIG